MGNPTYYRNEDTVVARALEVNPVANWNNGVNLAASNACGIGIGEAPNVVGTPNQFTLLDQASAARTPQLSQPIGGVAYNEGSSAPADPLTDEIRFVAPTASGDGDAVYVGQAHLVTLAAGWVPVV